MKKIILTCIVGIFLISLISLASAVSINPSNILINVVLAI